MRICFYLDSWIYILLGTGTLTRDYKVNGWDELWIMDVILRWESLTGKVVRRSYIIVGSWEWTVSLEQSKILLSQNSL